MSASSTIEPESDFVCDCDEWMRSACAGEPFYSEHQDKHYCVLHYPDQEKTAVFMEALKKKLDKQDFNFPGVWFPEAPVFFGFNFTSAADFRRATFSSDADFGQTTFSSGVNFKNATFIGRVSFRKASFKAGPKIDFTFTTFGALADFGFAAFDAVVHFSFASFIGQADFGKATFKGMAEFRSVEFGMWARFNRAAFSAHADFAGTTFAGKASFRTATLAAIYFRTVTFAAKADFRRVTFNERADFISSSFSAKAEFTGVNFRATADFSSAVFNASALFGNATFADHVKFSGSAQRPIFCDASSLDLHFARIEKPEHVSFHSLSLRPHWFVNVDARKFNLTHVDWHWQSTNDEIRSLQSKLAVSPHRLLAIACRHLAVNAEESQRYGEASRFRYMAMDAKRRTEARGFGFWKLSWWYWLASGYGERVMRAFLVLLGMLLVFAFFYTRVGFVRWESKPTSEREVINATRDDLGAPLSFGRALTYSAGVMTFQKPEPRPATTAAQTVVLLGTIFGPVQAALLALAIRRKFMR